MTPVLFRREGPDASDIVAIFPTLPGSPGMMTCYAHLGQHSSCSPRYIHDTKPARPEEYADLERELQRIGYDDLRVFARTQSWMHKARREAEARP